LRRDSEDLAESHLFGHEKGSFTGAVAQHVGMFEAARGGTLFLDEIAEMPAELQVKLLRTLETNTIMRVGGHEPIPLDVRIVAATHHDPVDAVRSGRLREDLFYRIATIALHVPALRQREDDVGDIAVQIIDRLNARHRTRKRLSMQAMKALRAYTWPGNVRELRNALERAFILADEQIELQLPRRQPPREEVRHNAMTLHIGATLAHTQQRFIVASLRHFNGDKPRTAKALGISLKTLYNRLALLPEHERNAVSGGAPGAATSGAATSTGRPHRPLRRRRPRQASSRDRYAATSRNALSQSRANRSIPKRSRASRLAAAPTRARGPRRGSACASHRSARPDACRPRRCCRSSRAAPSRSLPVQRSAARSSSPRSPRARGSCNGSD
jgi:hypothetical protein